MSYVVLARKWRPMSFRDLIGQEHVSRTLANAIEQQRVAHAFLFTGVRGVGKTTSARILAKALNCLQPGSGGDAHGLEPCLACAACREIAEGTDVDVREIDGASYTGVDEIRKLQESLPYRPTRDRYKIFIVDEVHMLSQNAWNALLKTLEEPPPHVKFILATTEVHKVPVTILSRVQRFDFKMIPSRLIAERIRYVLDNEHIEADERAVALVAREARGSMRDALSLLDQVIAFNSKQLIGDEVSRVLGLAGYTALLDLAAAVLSGEPPRVLTGVLGLSNQGCDITVVAKDLLAVFRDLVVAKLCKDTDELLDLSDEEQRRVRELAAGVDASDLMRVQQGFAKGFDDVARSAEPRAALEMLLARLALRPELLPLDGMMARLTELEGRLSTGKPPPSAQGSQRSGPAGGAPPGGAPRGGNARPAMSQTATASDNKPPPRAPAAAPMSAPVAPHPAPIPPAAPAPQAAPRAQPATPLVGVAVPAVALASAAPPATPEPVPARLLADWRRVLDCLGQTRPDLVAFLNHTVPLEISAELCTLGYEAGNALEARTRSAECLEALRAAAGTCFGQEPKIVFQPVGAGRQTLAETDKRARELQKKAAVDRAEQHPSVRDAAEILGARVKRIEVE